MAVTWLYVVLLQCKAVISDLLSYPNLFWPLPQNSAVFHETKCNQIAFNSRIELTDWFLK